MGKKGDAKRKAERAARFAAIQAGPQGPDEPEPKDSVGPKGLVEPQGSDEPKGSDKTTNETAKTESQNAAHPQPSERVGDSAHESPLFQDPHRLRSDARLITQMVELGCVDDAKAKAFVEKAFTLAENADSHRDFAAVAKIPIALAKLQLDADKLRKPVDPTPTTTVNVIQQQAVIVPQAVLEMDEQELHDYLGELERRRTQTPGRDGRSEAGPLPAGVVSALPDVAPA